MCLVSVSSVFESCVCVTGFTAAPRTIDPTVGGSDVMMATQKLSTLSPFKGTTTGGSTGRFTSTRELSGTGSGLSRAAEMVCVCVISCMFLCVCMCVCIRACSCVCMCACVISCLFLCVYVYVCV